MSRKFNMQNVVLAAAMTLGAGAAFVSQPVYAQGAKCTGSLKDADVKAACDKGGLDGAKDYMKDLVKKAKAKNKDSKHDCKDCHENQKDFKLKSNAEGDLKKLKAEAG